MNNFLEAITLDYVILCLVSFICLVFVAYRILGNDSNDDDDFNDGNDDGYEPILPIGNGPKIMFNSDTRKHASFNTLLGEKQEVEEMEAV